MTKRGYALKSARSQRFKIVPSTRVLLSLRVALEEPDDSTALPADSTALGAASTALGARLTALGTRLTVLGTVSTTPPDDLTTPLRLLCANAQPDSARTNAVVVVIVLTEFITLDLLGCPA